MDHIIPRAIVVELDNVIANLELMPLKANEGKSDKIGERQLSLGRKLRKAGFLSDKGWRKLKEAQNKEPGISQKTKATKDSRSPRSFGFPGQQFAHGVRAGGFDSRPVSQN